MLPSTSLRLGGYETHSMLICLLGIQPDTMSQTNRWWDILPSIAMILGKKSTQKPQKIVKKPSIFWYIKQASILVIGITKIHIATSLEKANEKLVVSRALIMSFI